VGALELQEELRDGTKQKLASLITALLEGVALMLGKWALGLFGAQLTCFQLRSKEDDL